MNKKICEKIDKVIHHGMEEDLRKGFREINDYIIKNKNHELHEIMKIHKENRNIGFSLLEEADLDKDLKDVFGNCLRELTLQKMNLEVTGHGMVNMGEKLEKLKKELKGKDYDERRIMEILRQEPKEILKDHTKFLKFLQENV